jgi:hypothetical protein
MLVVNIRRKISAFSFRSSRGNVRLRALPSLAAPTGVYTNWTSPVFRDFSDFMNVGHDCTESNFRLVGSAYQACLPHRDHRSVASRNSQRRSPEENTAPAEACRPVSDTEPTLERGIAPQRKHVPVRVAMPRCFRTLCRAFNGPWI